MLCAIRTAFPISFDLMTLPSYERLGVFYLGREYDPASQQIGADLLYDSRDLTTHAVCIGMTGSGKTGLCLSLLEEAALDGVPAIAIDPKGDIGNLLLTFPELRAEDFRPWVDEGEASRKGKTVDEFAAATADNWRKGLGEWGQDGARIARLREAADVAIYTPGSDSGRPLSVLRSFAAPDPATLSDATALKERISSAVAGLLALLGIEADPIKSREHMLLSAILDTAWRQGESPDLAALIQSVQKPPFDKIGVFDVETFYPAKDRMELALRVNGLLAAPGFDAWLHGEALDVQKLLYTADGKPRIAIISIAHLNDAERMFVVTLIANELVAWMRRQSGTTSLRALFYMDEVFGYFPPSAMPPSKLPLLTLMKQARAFGIGVVLATQNPVDLDYKGLGNAGTWFIGRLQTDRDKQRVLEGLLGSEAAGGLDRAGYEALMSNLTQRTFLMRNVHDDAPVLFRTRWAMSYLRGPLTLNEIKRLTPRTQVGTVVANRRFRGNAHGCGCDAHRRIGREQRTPGRAARRHGAIPRLRCWRSAALPAAHRRTGARALRRHEGRSRHLADHVLPGARRQGRSGLGASRDHGRTGPGFRARTGGRRDVRRAAGCGTVDAQSSQLEQRSGRSRLSQCHDRSARVSVAQDDCGAGHAGRRVPRAARRWHCARSATMRSRRCARSTARSSPRSRIANGGPSRRSSGSRRRPATRRCRPRCRSAAACSARCSAADGAALRRARSTTAARSVGRASKERSDVAHAEADARAVREQIEALNAELEAEVARIESESDPGYDRARQGVGQAAQGRHHGRGRGARLVRMT